MKMEKKRNRVRLSVDSDRERKRSQSKDTKGNREDNQAHKGMNNYNKSNRSTTISSPHGIQFTQVLSIDLLNTQIHQTFPLTWNVTLKAQALRV